MLREAVRTLIADAVSAGASLEIIAASGSMRPLIKVGSRVIVQPKKPPFRIGEIALQRLPSGAALLHRIIAIDGDMVVTMGDALETPDTPCRVDDLLGIAISIDGHRVDTPTWRQVNRWIAALSPHARTLRMPLRLAGRLRRALGLTWL